MADVGMDRGKSNVEKKCVPVIFPPVLGLRGELGSSEVNEDLGRPALGAPLLFTLRYHPFHRVMSLFFPSSHVAGTSRGELGGMEGGRGTSRVPVSSYCMNARTHSRMQLRRHARERGSPGAVYDQFLIIHVRSFRENYLNSRALAPSLSPTHSGPRFDLSASLSPHRCQTLNG